MFIIVIGGSGSGKSEFAERMTQQISGENQKVYMATMQPFTEESRMKILRHQRIRKEKGFVTVERYTNLAEWKDSKSSQTVLLECMSNLVSNEWYGSNQNVQRTKEAIRGGIDNLLKRCQSLCVVTNDIFEDGGCYSKETLEYQKLLGEINRTLVEEADIVVEVVYGIPILHKGADQYEALFK